MDPQEYENREASQEVTDTESGVLQEELQPNDHPISSPDGSIYEPRTSRSISARKTRKRTRSSISQENASDDEKEESGANAQGRYTSERIRQDAIDWAARFKGPENGQVRSPTRRSAGSRSIKRKVLAPSKARAKRLKGYYSNEYTALVNIDIRDAVKRITNEEQNLGESSQIGVSMWTSIEKDMFFASLSRLGRDDVRGISQRIGSKSELQVQEYIQLLHEAMVGRDDLRHQFHITDVPAALEVTEECCSVLDRAADALESRQERHEEEAEQAKWGENWQLTPDVCNWIRKKQVEEDEEDALGKVLPAANFLNLKNWLALSERIFMNPGAPREEDNWQNLAEAGEEPSIRATAFGDFHSLAVYTTKRIISTVLFCTMSKLRSMDSNKIKHSEIVAADVDAAVKILGLPANSRDYWAKCARRCNLKVYAEGLPGEGKDDNCLSYDDVESALSGAVSSSEFQSSRKDSPVSEEVIPDQEADTDASEFEVDYDQGDDDSDDGHSNEALEDPDEQALDLEDDNETDGITDISDSESLTHHDRTERALKRRKTIKAYEHAQDIYTEAMDKEASRAAEKNLWTLLRQTAPFESKTEIEIPELPKTSARNMVGSFVDWRANTEYWSQWEMMDRPVPEESFLRLSEEEKKFKARQSRRAKRNIAGDSVDMSESDDSEEGIHHNFAEEQDSDGDAISHMSVSSGMRSPRKNTAAPGRSSMARSIKSESEYEE